MTEVPSEHDEAVLLVDWCDAMGIDIWHIPMETYTTSWNAKKKNKSEGVRKGISDYLVFLPESRVRVPSGVLLWIELKKRRRVLKNGKLGGPSNTPSPEQLDFIEKMNTVKNVQGMVAYGADEAIGFIKKFSVR